MDQLRDGDFDFITELENAPELPENFGKFPEFFNILFILKFNLSLGPSLAESVQNFEELISALGISESLIESFVIQLYSSSPADLGALINAELG